MDKDGKAKKEEAPKGEATPKVTPKDLAKEFGTTPYKVRVYLRGLEKFKDGTYTRYGWDPSSKELEEIRKGLKAKFSPSKEEWKKSA